MMILACLSETRFLYTECDKHDPLYKKLKVELKEQEVEEEIKSL